MRKTFFCLWLITLLLQSHTKLSIGSPSIDEDTSLLTKAAITKARFSCTRMFYPLKVELIKNTSLEAKVFIRELDDLKESIANFLKLMRDGYLPSIPLNQLKEYKGLKLKLTNLRNDLDIEISENQGLNLNHVLIEYAFKSILNSIAAKKKTYANKEINKCFITYASESGKEDYYLRFVRKLAKHLKWASMDISIEVCNNINQENKFIEEVKKADVILLLGTFMLMKEYNSKVSITYSNINYIHSKQREISTTSVIFVALEKEIKILSLLFYNIKLFWNFTITMITIFVF